MIKAAVAKLVEGHSLSEREARDVMGQIMEGEATPAQLAAFLVAHRLKGETEDEILGFAQAMRSKALAISFPDDLLDTCGTGGDSSGTYNISTCSALVVAAAGIKVAKHGNRSATSQCGSADVLESLGVHLSLTPEQAIQALNELGFAFLFAPSYHPAMKYAAPVRGEIGVRTVFNILGPLSNPAGATRQLLGVADPAISSMMASVMTRLGVERGMVVHGHGGLDEISISGPTWITEIVDNKQRAYEVTPEIMGVASAPLHELAGGDRLQNAEIVRSLFRGTDGPKRDALLVNAAAAIYLGGLASDLTDGVKIAAQVIDGGAAMVILDRYIEFTQAAARQ